MHASAVVFLSHTHIYSLFPRYRSPLRAAAQISTLLQNLQTQLGKLSKEIQEFQMRYKITVQRPGAGALGAAMPVPVGDLTPTGGGKSSGVLAL